MSFQLVMLTTYKESSYTMVIQKLATKIMVRKAVQNPDAMYATAIVYWLFDAVAVLCLPHVLVGDQSCTGIQEAFIAFLGAL